MTTTMPDSASGTLQKGPENARKLGKSRPYTKQDMPARLLAWHAPRVNRWEKLQIEQGSLAVEQLSATQTHRFTLEAGEHYWFAPGVRWQVAVMPADTRFVLEIYAGDKGQAAAPHPLRSAWLDDAERVRFSHFPAFHHAVQNHPSTHWLLADLDFILSSGQVEHLLAPTRYWHPLCRQKETSTVLVTNSATAFDLADYLGRDHQVIEAALGGMLAGKHEYRTWFAGVLERHMRMEEQVVFPAWLAAGGKTAWVDGLVNEHRLLREHLQSLNEADTQRKLLRLLDAHDEKEERVVYPDIVSCLGHEASQATMVACQRQPLPEAAVV